MSRKPKRPPTRAEHIERTRALFLAPLEQLLQPSPPKRPTEEGGT